MTDAESNELTRLRAESVLRRYCQSLPDLVAPDDVASLLLADGIEADSSGQISLSTAAAAIERMKGSRPYLFRSARADRGIVDSPGAPPQRQLSDIELAPKLFGRLSNAADASRLARADKASYVRIKEVAKRLGLID